MAARSETGIALEPDRSHCIQTVAKREYDRTLRELLAAEEDRPELAQRMETLRIFLESTDFAKLRREYEPHLTTGKRVTFTLHPAGGKTEYRMRVS